MNWSNNINTFISLLTEEEKDEILYQWNNTDQEFSFAHSLPQLIEQQALTKSKQIALRQNEISLSYQLLNASANQLAHYLKSLGIGPELVVAIGLPRCPEMVITILAILKTGAAYLPLDLSNPAERLQFMLADAGACVLITDTAHEENFTGYLGQYFLVDQDWEAQVHAQSTENLGIEIHPASLAYVIYTSGSTGQPKGVLIEHGSLLNYLQWCLTVYPCELGVGTTIHSSFAFDMVMTSLFIPLIVGKTIHLMPEQLGAEALLKALNDDICYSFIKLTPSHLNLLRGQLTAEDLSRKTHALILGGEKLLKSEVDHWQHPSSTLKIFNEYGPTESTVACSVYEVGSSALENDNIPIGKPIANLKNYIFAENLSLVPVGISGELYIGGVGLARSYLGRQELTQDRFIINPYIANERLYRTGDRARYLADGNIEYLGRFDEQIKLRGYRIELGEIESVLAKHGLVKQVAVLLQEESDTLKRLVCYVECKERALNQEQVHLKTATLEKYLAAQLPDYMVPNQLILIDQFPLTANGKIDRKKLSTVIIEKSFSPPTTESEKQLAAIWSELLCVAEISKTDHFFELGGDSILSIQLILKAQQSGLTLTIKQIFDYPILSDLAKQLENSENQIDLPIIPVIGRTSKLLLSFGQQRLWFLEQLEPNNVIYNVPLIVQFTGRLNPVHLQKALDHLVQRHEILRTVIGKIDAEDVQKITESNCFALITTNLAHLPQEEQQRTIKQLLHQELNTSFDLTQGPLIRGNLISLNESENILFLLMHHIISDGWSLVVLMKDLSVLYNNELGGEKIALPSLRIQYADFAAWQRQWLQGERLKNQLDYWQKQLSNFPEMITLPTDRPRPKELSYRGAIYRYTISSIELHEIKSLAEKQRVTLFMMLLAAFQVLLHRYSGQNDIVVGTPVANRHYPDTSELIGFFVNTLPLRAKFHEGLTFEQFLAQVQETAQHAYTNQDVPFEQLIDHLQIGRRLDCHPLFQVMFVQQNVGGDEIKLNGLQSKLLNIDIEVAKFDLTVFVQETKTSLEIGFDYATDLFDQTTIARFATHFECLLNSIVQQPTQMIDKLSLQLVEDKHVHLSSHKKIAPYHIVQLFEQAVLKHNNQIALQNTSRQLTYDALNQSSNRLAHYLTAMGVGREVIVAVSLPDPLEMVIAILGILKAGGAYLPIDPTYPEDRIAFLLSDAANHYLLTVTSLEDKFLGYHGHTIWLDEEQAGIDSLSSENLLLSIEEKQLAYVIYTSGSTGQPKGVCVEHKSLSHLAQVQGGLFGITADSRVLQFASMSFDASVSEWSTTLTCGGSLYFLARAAVGLLEPLATTINKYEITLVTLPPSVLQLLRHEEVPSLKTIVVAGEASSDVLLSYWRRRVRLINAYGPTESTVCASMHEVDGIHPAGTIGHAIGEVKLYVLDQFLAPMPIGVPGEIYIGGICLARGYLNRQALTEERFISNPYVTGERLYRSGDRGRYLADGNIEYLGRIDDQVKLRGYRIELGEVGSVASAHPSVKEAVAILREDVPGQKRLVTYVVLQSEVEAASAPETIQSYLEEKLPNYMVPTIVILKQMPLTSNGKIDRKGLPAPEEGGCAETYAAPRTEIEETLSQIWSNLLQLERVGIHDNFFQIGGDSILSIQLVSRAREKGLYFTVKQVFENPNIAMLVNKVKLVSQKYQPATQQALFGSFPLTPIQRWFFDQSWQKINHFNQAILLDVSLVLSIEHIKAGLLALIRHHDALRLHFRQNVNQWQQQYLEVCEEEKIIDFESIDSTLTTRVNSVETVLISEIQRVQRGLDIKEGPLLRAVFIKGQDEQKLLLVAHHLIIDTVSWRILSEDLNTACRQLLQHQEIALPAKTHAYRDWSEALARYFLKGKLQEEYDYWCETVKAFSPLTFRENLTESAIENKHKSIKVSLSLQETIQLIREVPKAYNTRIHEILLIALTQAVAELTVNNQVSLFLEGHGREEIDEQIDLSRTVGWFTTVFPIHLDLADRANLPTLIKSIKEQIRTIPSNGLGYGILRYLSNEKMQMLVIANEIVAQSLSFNYLGQFETRKNDTDSLINTTATLIPDCIGSENQLPTMLNLNCLISDNTFEADWSYDETRISSDVTHMLAQKFIGYLQQLISHCSHDDAYGYTPVDFPLAKEMLTQSLLDKIFGQKPNVTEIYPLTPMQEGLLFYGLYHAASDVYLAQSVFEIQGYLQVEKFKEAWQAVVSHHDVFRTGFVWEGLKAPLQYVVKHVDLPWHVYDWQVRDEKTFAESLTEFLREDRKNIFSLSSLPFFRLSLIKLRENKYYLIWSQHHILFDGWSSPIVIRHLLHAYRQLLNNAPIQLPYTPRYQAYVQWLMTQDSVEAKQFWHQYLQGFHEPTHLSHIKRTTQPIESQYKQYEFTFNSNETQILKLFAQSQKLTLSTILQGAWGILLGRYTDRNDILFGMTVSGRSGDLDNSTSFVGLLINTIPFRLQLHDTSLIIDFLNNIQSMMSKLNQYSFLSLAQIQACAAVKCNETSHLFDHIFSFINFISQEDLSHDLPIDFKAVQGVENTEYPLTLFIVPDKSLRIRFRYQSQYFEDSQIRFFASQFKKFVKYIQNNINGYLSELTLLSQYEREKLLIDQSNTTRNAYRDKTLPDLFVAQVTQSFQAIAVIHASEEISYQSLNFSANRLANYLVSLGIVPNALVAVCLEQSSELVSVLLAILKAGGAYVYLDPTYPQERIDYLLNDTGASILISSTELLDKYSVSPLVQVIDIVTEHFEHYPDTDPHVRITPNDLAYVMYTSGSTGKPKGVMVPHRAIIRLVKETNFIEFERNDRVGQSSSLAFDAATLEVWGALLNGCTLVICQKELALDPERLAEFYRKKQVNIAWLTSSLFNYIVMRTPSAFSQLKTLIIGGEKLNSRVLKKYFEEGVTLPSRLLNGYGPTENTVFSATYEIDPRNFRSEADVPIGFPIANTIIYLLDNDLNPVPQGMRGEIYVSGPGLALGYLNNSTLTEERFIANPFVRFIQENQEDYQLLYRTGDLGYYQQDGSLMYLGRADNQIKLRGYRIELEEIESALSSFSQVAQSVVLFKTCEQEADSHLVAYITLHQKSAEMADKGLIDKLRTHLMTILPEYMIPRSFMVLPEFPLTVNGKLDRQKLLDLSHQSVDANKIPPRNTLENILVSIWREVLEIEELGINENYFELGGDSIKSVRIVGLAANQGISLQIGDLFTYQTIAELSARATLQIAPITRVKIEPFSLLTAEDNCVLPHEKIEDAFPLTDLQKGMLFHTAINEAMPIYQDTLSYLIEGQFDYLIWQVVLEKMLKKHAVFRTAFHLDGYSEPLQLVYRHSPLILYYEDISHLDQMNQDALIKQWIKNEQQTRLSIDQSPVIRFALHKRSHTTVQFGFSFHHASLDGWSVAVFVTDVLKNYRQRLLENELSENSLTLPYAYYVHLEKQAVTDSAQTQFWLNKLTDCEPVKLPRWVSKNIQLNEVNEKQTVRLAISARESDALHCLAQELHVPVKSIFLAAYCRVLSMLTGKQKIITGIVVNTRPEYEFSDQTLGLFLSTLPLVIDLPGSSWAELIRLVHASENEILAYRFYSLLAIQEALNRRELFETMFNYVHFHVYREANDDTVKITEMDGYAQTNYALAVQVFQEIDTRQLGVDLEYDSSIFCEAQISAIAGYLKNALMSMLSNCHDQWNSVSLLSDRERNLLTKTWNATDKDFPREITIIDVLESQAENNPLVTAAICNNRELNYQQLNQFANSICYHLLDKGVKSENIIAILLDRELEFLIAMLGIFKAGAAYVPIDPKLPVDRIAGIIDDTNAVTIITEAKYLSLTEAISSATQVSLVSDLLNHACSSNNPDKQILSQQLAYVIYTSGSTGKPKGVLIEHLGMMNHLLAKVEDLELKCNDRIAQTASQSFDISVWQFLVGILIGAAVVIFKEEDAWDPPRLLPLLQHHKVSIFETVPSHLIAILELVESQETYRFSLLRWLLVTGEVLLGLLCKRWFAQIPDVPMLNAYGPTECSDDVMHAKIMSAPSINSAVPLSGIIRNTSVYILDSSCQPVPMGTTGEIYIGGLGVGRGYLNDSEKTKKSFIHDPFSTVENARLYKTGDLGYFTPDGEIEFLGRSDQQVKIRGYRIELGEIEATLNAHPDIQQAVVTVRENEMQGKTLIAYLVMTEQKATEVGLVVLKTFLLSKLPEYMLPSVFILLDEMPLTTAGKIDRQSLPAPNAGQLHQNVNQPLTEVEHQVAQVWSELLRVENPDIHDSFFQLGGHSLLATQLISRLRRLFKCELPLKIIFEYPTIAALSQYITDHSDDNETIMVIERVSRAQSIALSFSQERLWFIDKLIANKSLYNIPLIFDIEGDLDTEILEQAFTIIVRRHEILRTKIQEQQGDVAQVVQESEPFSLEKINLTNLTLSQQTLAKEQAIVQFITQPFNLVNDLLFRVKLIILSNTQSYLCFCLHHIIFDGWSTDVLLRDLSSVYNALKNNACILLPPLSIQYADFAMWQRKWLQGPIAIQQFNYWKKQLEDLPDCLNLPTKQVRPVELTYKGQVYRHRINAEFLRKLTLFAQTHEVTLFMMLLSIFQLLLYRFSGQDDLVVGTPIANRRYPGVENLIGLFVNLLVLRHKIDVTQSFAELLPLIKKLTLDAFEHQDIPFENLVEHLASSRSLNRHPIFQVMFALHHSGKPPIFQGLQVKSVSADMPFARLDLSVAVQEIDAELILWFEYATDLFDQSTIVLMAEHFELLIGQIVTNPTQPLYQLFTLTNNEQQLLHEWNNTISEFPRQDLIHQLFEAEVQKTPNAIAVSDGSQSLSYKALNSKANQLAHYLQTLNVNPGTYVMVSMERCLTLVICLLAIQKAGGIYVPLDLVLPTERLRFMIEEVNPTVILLNQKLSPQLETLLANRQGVVTIDAFNTILDSEKTENLSLPLHSLQTSYVIYTSGSTGKPKGVCNSHQALVNRIFWMQSAYPLSANDCVLQKTPYSFDVSLWEFFWPLCFGGKLLMAPPEIHKDPVALIDFIHQYQVSIIHFVPSMLTVFLNQKSVTKCHSLRMVFVSGEIFHFETARKFFSVCQAQLSNLYGPTEAAIDVTYYRCDPSDPGPLLPIGKPIANTTIAILDQYQKPVPLGVAGELHIGGLGLASGYLNQPALTAAKFIQDPYSHHPNARLYRTGDLARYLQDGNIQYLGRLDHQVKWRGYRIELEEIEAVLNNYSLVSQSLVMLNDLSHDKQQLVAYVVTTNTVVTDKDKVVLDIKQYLTAYLPEYMQPSQIFLLSQFPVTSNGKIDRQALKALSEPVVVSVVMPRNETEQTLLHLFEQVLHRKNISVSDHFFNLGGYSLLAIELINCIATHFDVDLPLKSIFQYPSIAALARYIDHLVQYPNDISSPKTIIGIVDRDKPLPLSFAQQRLWFLDKMMTHKEIYNVPVAMKLIGDLNQDVLRRTLTQLILRHEILRMRIWYAEDDSPLQVFVPPSEVDLEEVDYSKISTTQQFTRVSDSISAVIKRPFNLHDDALLRVVLITLNESNHILLFNFHHIIIDLWSLNLFFKELSEIYSALISGNAITLTPLPFQYADFAVWQRQWLSEDLLNKQYLYWQNKLQDFPQCIELPLDFPRPKKATYRGDIYKSYFDHSILNDIHTFCAQHNVTPFVFLLSAFAILLHRYTGQDQIVVGTPIANRHYQQVDQLLGLFINTLAIPIQCEDDPCYSHFLMTIQETLLDAFEYQDLPFEQLVDRLRIDRDLAYHPIFQVLFEYQNNMDDKIKLGDIAVEFLEAEISMAKFDLTLSIQEGQHGMGLRFEYASDLFRQETIVRMATHFKYLVTQIIQSPSHTLSQLDYLENDVGPFDMDIHGLTVEES